ncbi:hypothetical protein [Oryzifoliimicrobium ureilyticus]|uniref:hypothetical protein n=1 Tax=Oryzifoliimicrobium ureilyticus TaxID=3113724 RepID=UPI0030765897
MNMLVPVSFFKYIPGDTRQLDLIFSQCFVAPGQFAIERLLTDNRHHCVFLNTANNDFYQHGVPGLGTSVDETAATLRQFARQIGVTRIRCLGMSMGASAAILFGSLLGADRVVAVGPEIEIGLPFHRSEYHNRDKRFHLSHRLLAPHVAALGDRLHLTFPAYDMGDWLHAAMATEIGAPFLWIRQFHSGGQSIDWPALLAADACESPLRMFLTTGTEEPLPPAQLRFGAAAHIAFCRKDHKEAVRIAAHLFDIKPLAGLAFFIAANLYCQGLIAEADIWLRRTLALDHEGLARPIRFDYDYSHWLPNRERALMRERLSILRGLTRPDPSS